MERVIRQRLMAIGRRVREKFEKCEAILEQIRVENERISGDELEVTHLKKSMELLQKEMGLLLKGGQCSDEMQKFIQALTDLQLQATELITELECEIKQRSTVTGIGQRGSQDNFYDISQLPKLELNTFGGQVTEWEEFWDTFTSLIERKNLRNVDKLLYLKKCLEGEARSVVGGLPSTNANYKIAVDRLKDRYAKPSKIIDAHVRAITTLPQADNTIADCRNTLNEIEKHLAVLETKGVSTNTNLLRSIILDKFPDTVTEDLRFKDPEGNCSVVNLRKYLSEIISSRENSSYKLSTNKAPSDTPSFTTESLHSNTKRESNVPNKKGGPPQRSQSNNANQTGFKRRQNGKNFKRGNNRNQEEPASQRPGSDASKQDKSHSESSRGGPPTKRRRPDCCFCKGDHYGDRCTEYTTLEQKRKALKGCFRCLNSTHFIRECKSKGHCKKCNSTSHHWYLCPESQKSENTNEKPQNTTINFSIVDYDTILPTALALVTGSAGRKKRCRILLDTGSQRSYLNAATAAELKLPSLEAANLTVYSFGNPKPQTIRSSLVNLDIQGKEGNLEALVYVVPTTTNTLPSFFDLKTKLSTLHPSVDFAIDTKVDSKADIIIGNDFYHKIVSGERKQITDTLYMVNTQLGWIVSGQISAENDCNALSVLTYVSHSKKGNPFSPPDTPLDKDNVKDIWELETIGIRDTPKMLQDEEAVQYFNETTKRIGTRYFVKWPWVVYPPDLPINFGQSVGRLRSLLKHSSTDLLKKYDSVLQEQLDKGVIEIVHEDKLPNSHPVHYLPHHCVIQEHKTTKLRIVYDGSAKSQGQNSLNESLYKGPSLLEDLTALLLKFRSHPVGIISDVEKAFLQIGLQEADRDVTRFLWVKDLAKEPIDSNLLHMRFCRVPFGIISSPFLLAATVRFHLAKSNNPIADQIAKHLYVDNLVTGTTTTANAISLYSGARELFDKLSMNIREWNSNDQDFLNSLPPGHRKEQSPVSVLGIIWDTKGDKLTLGISSAVLDQPANTKRQILRIIASVFDPCGWAAPATLPARIFLQSLWEEKFKWDTPLHTDQQQQWSSCITILKAVLSITLPRYYLSSSHCVPLTDTENELHCFVDASRVAYVAAVYLRTKMRNEQMKERYAVTLIISKSRLTPLKHRDTFTIPKLELLALLIGTRLVTYVKDTLQLPYKAVTVWSDSTIALSWLKTDKLLPPFVSRRVTEIRQNTQVQFRHVPTEHNPADVATRQLRTVVIPDIWFQGPAFLETPSYQWQHYGVQALTVDTALSLPINTNNTATTMATTSSDSNLEPNTNDLLMAPAVEDDANLLPEHGVEAESSTLRTLQKRYFPREVCQQVTPLAKSLGLYLDNEGVLRCKGRFACAAFTPDQKHPILIPKSSPFTDAVVQRIHVENFHVGVSHTLSLVRSRYWIPQGRAKVSSVLRTCAQCLRHGGGPYRLPHMPDLPTERVTYSSPFTYTGLDYFGPLTILDNDIPVKRYCCLFTCMSTRAIHLELVLDLSGNEFLLGLRRFVATRGCPKLIVSDNATHFKLAATILASPYIIGHKVTWKFIPSLSPWQGGFYERLVGLVKHCLYRSLGDSLLTNNQLYTVLKEIEATLNTRPLTVVGKDPETILTPAHFLRSCGPSAIEFEDNPEAQLSTAVIRDKVVSSWSMTNRLLDKFRLMFVNQYLLSLREHHRFDHPQARVVSSKAPAVGDLVQLKGEQRNRAHWKVGRITSLLFGTDGQARTAIVTLPGGTVINRSVGHLYPLELDAIDASRGISQPTSPSSPSAPQPCSSSSPPTLSTPPPASPHLASSDLPSTTHDAVETASTDPMSLAAIPARPRRSAAIASRDKVRAWVAALFSAAVTHLS